METPQNIILWENLKSHHPIKEIFDPSEEAFLKETTKELVSIISNEWLEELEFSSNVIA
jgi:hypothetical protein